MATTMARGKAAITFFREPPATSCDSPMQLPKQPESLAEDPETLSISCEVTFRHGTLRFNGNVSEKLLTLLIQELKR
ncbi:IS66 family element, orf1 [Escherichia coli]|uniref:IS66 family element, orf1 n=1 Tax=Escherichia coli TaxID=562 RepID=A0A376RP23_ECOLX|nr:IS66 family element, orf1 [Escherichia coli]